MSEAAGLADVFQFHLMFRLYRLPDKLSDYLATGERGPNAAADYFGRKRMLSTFAARKYPMKLTRDGKAVAYTRYLMLSAIAEDIGSGACSALRGSLCGIRERRPLSCRSAPLHYSRPEVTAERDLAAFAATPGFRCDTSEKAPVVLRDGRVVDEEMAAARTAAVEIARRDRRWSAAIVDRLGKELPSLDEIEANTSVAATTVPMTVAWTIARDAGLISRAECDRLAALQRRVGNYASLSA